MAPRSNAICVFVVNTKYQNIRSLLKHMMPGYKIFFHCFYRILLKWKKNTYRLKYCQYKRWDSLLPVTGWALPNHKKGPCHTIVSSAWWKQLFSVKKRITDSPQHLNSFILFTLCQHEGIIFHGGCMVILKVLQLGFLIFFQIS